MGRRKLVLAALIVIILAGAGIWSAKPWRDLAASSRISLFTDAGGQIASRELKANFTGLGEGRPVLAAELDLSEAAGELLKIDLHGEVTRRWPRPQHKGYLLYSAEVVSPEGREAIEFMGWRNDEDPEFFMGALGSPTAAPIETGDGTYFYDSDNAIWHVLRVPEQARLSVKATPRLSREIAHTDSRPARGAAVPFRSIPREEPGRRPDVFIYLIDTLRADHLGCYGYERPTSPKIDRFAEESVLFEQAQSLSSWTMPSVGSLLTGLYPRAHGAIYRKISKMKAWPVLLSEALQKSGYQTCAVGTNGNISDTFGFDRGYDSFTSKTGKSAKWANERAADFLREAGQDEPVFMYIHTMEPHAPYAPRPDSRELFDRGFDSQADGSLDCLRNAGLQRPTFSAAELGHLIDLYDADIYDSDREFGQFLDLLKETGRFDGAIIILLSDHGESFAEHDTLVHGHTLNSQEMRVPLVVRLPGGELGGRRVQARVALVDIYPTIIELVGAKLQLDYPLPGRDLLATVRDEAAAAGRLFHAEVSLFEDNRLFLLATIDEEGYKRVINASPPERSMVTGKSLGLWNTTTDPAEQKYLSREMPVRAAYGEQLIAQWLVEQQQWARKEPEVREQPVIREELRRELEALGYLD